VRSWFLRRSARCRAPEKAQLDGFLALASLPGRRWQGGCVIEALAEAAWPPALPRALSLQLAGGMMAGSVQLLQQQQLHPGQLKDIVARPRLAPRSRPSGAWSRTVCVPALIEGVLAAAERPAGPWPKAELSGWISWRRFACPASVRCRRSGAPNGWRGVRHTTKHGGEPRPGPDRPAACRFRRS